MKLLEWESLVEHDFVTHEKGCGRREKDHLF